jgi:hypothetical protein
MATFINHFSKSGAIKDNSYESSRFAPPPDTAAAKTKTALTDCKEEGYVPVRFARERIELVSTDMHKMKLRHQEMVAEIIMRFTDCESESQHHYVSFIKSLQQKSLSALKFKKQELSRISRESTTFKEQATAEVVGLREKLAELQQQKASMLQDSVKDQEALRLQTEREIAQLSEQQQTEAKRMAALASTNIDEMRKQEAEREAVLAKLREDTVTQVLADEAIIRSVLSDILLQIEVTDRIKQESMLAQLEMKLREEVETREHQEREVSDSLLMRAHDVTTAQADAQEARAQGAAERGKLEADLGALRAELEVAQLELKAASGDAAAQAEAQADILVAKKLQEAAQVTQEATAREVAAGATQTNGAGAGAGTQTPTAEYRGPVTPVGKGQTTGAKYVGRDGEAIGADGDGNLRVKFDDGETDYFAPASLKAHGGGGGADLEGLKKKLSEAVGSQNYAAAAQLQQQIEARGGGRAGGGGAGAGTQTPTAEYRGPVTPVGKGQTTGAKYVGQDGEAIGADGDGNLRVKFDDGETDYFAPASLQAPVGAGAYSDQDRLQLETLKKRCQELEEALGMLPSAEAPLELGALDVDEVADVLSFLDMGKYMSAAKSANVDGEKLDFMVKKYEGGKAATANTSETGSQMVSEDDAVAAGALALIIPDDGDRERLAFAVSSGKWRDAPSTKTGLTVGAPDPVKVAEMQARLGVKAAPGTAVVPMAGTLGARPGTGAAGGGRGGGRGDGGGGGAGGGGGDVLTDGETSDLVGLLKGLGGNGAGSPEQEKARREKEIKEQAMRQRLAGVNDAIGKAASEAQEAEDALQAQLTLAGGIQADVAAKAKEMEAMMLAKKKNKQEIKRWLKKFREENAREPENADKEAIRPLYVRHSELELETKELKNDLQSAEKQLNEMNDLCETLKTQRELKRVAELNAKAQLEQAMRDKANIEASVFAPPVTVNVTKLAPSAINVKITRTDQQKAAEAAANSAALAKAAAEIPAEVAEKLYALEADRQRLEQELKEATDDKIQEEVERKLKEMEEDREALARQLAVARAAETEAKVQQEIDEALARERATIAGELEAEYEGKVAQAVEAKITEMDAAKAKLQKELEESGDGPSSKVARAKLAALEADRERLQKELEESVRKQMKLASALKSDDKLVKELKKKVEQLAKELESCDPEKVKEERRAQQEERAALHADMRKMTADTKKQQDEAAEQVAKAEEEAALAQENADMSKQQLDTFEEALRADEEAAKDYESARADLEGQLRVAQAETRAIFEEEGGGEEKQRRPTAIGLESQAKLAKSMNAAEAGMAEGRKFARANKQKEQKAALIGAASNVLKALHGDPLHDTPCCVQVKRDLNATRSGRHKDVLPLERALESFIKEFKDGGKAGGGGDDKKGAGAAGGRRATGAKAGALTPSGSAAALPPPGTGSERLEAARKHEADLEERLIAFTTGAFAGKAATGVAVAAAMAEASGEGGNANIAALQMKASKAERELKMEREKSDRLQGRIDGQGEEMEALARDKLELQETLAAGGGSEAAAKAKAALTSPHEAKKAERAAADAKGGGGSSREDQLKIKQLEKKLKEGTMEAAKLTKQLKVSQEKAEAAKAGGGDAEKKQAEQREKMQAKKLADLEKKAKKELDDATAKLEAALKAAEKKKDAALASLETTTAALKERDAECKAQLKQLKEYSTMDAELERLQLREQEAIQTEKDLAEQIKLYGTLETRYKEEQALRKKFHNMIEDMKGKIRVYARCRPMAKYELEKGCSSVVSFVDETTLDLLTNRGPREFAYDAVFSPQNTQAEVFEDTKSLILSAFDGFNVCIFAYGQTGSGKTFTMTGVVSNPDLQGITPRACGEIFGHIAAAEGVSSTNLKCYMVELYNDAIVDLFWKMKHKGSKEVRAREAVREPRQCR